MAISNSAYANRRALHLDYYSTIKKSASPTRLGRRARPPPRASPWRAAWCLIPAARDPIGRQRTIVKAQNAEKCLSNGRFFTLIAALRRAAARAHAIHLCVSMHATSAFDRVRRARKNFCGFLPAAARGARSRRKNARIASRRFGWRRFVSGALRRRGRSPSPRAGAPTVRVSPLGDR